MPSLDGMSLIALTVSCAPERFTTGVSNELLHAQLPPAESMLFSFGQSLLSTPTFIPNTIAGHNHPCSVRASLAVDKNRLVLIGCDRLQDLSDRLVLGAPQAAYTDSNKVETSSSCGGSFVYALFLRAETHHGPYPQRRDPGEGRQVRLGATEYAVGDSVNILERIAPLVSCDSVVQAERCCEQ